MQLDQIVGAWRCMGELSQPVLPGLAPSSMRTPRIRSDAQRRLEEKSELLAVIDVREPARCHPKNLLDAVVEVSRRNAEPAERTPNQVEVLVDQLTKAILAGPRSRAAIATSRRGRKLGGCHHLLVW